MMKPFFFSCIALFLSVLPATLQDTPKPPISVQVELVGPTNPIRVADRPAGLKLTLIDSLGKPAPLNSALTIGSSDPTNPINGFQIILANGVGVLRDAVQFFTVGKHEISATSSDGTIKGKLTNIDVKPSQDGITFKVEKPEPIPSNSQAGTAFIYRGKLTTGDKPVVGKEARIKGSKGVAIFPQRLFTDDQGFFQCFIFVPELCVGHVEPGPGPGPGPIETLNGDIPLRIESFVDCNGDNSCTASVPEPSITLPPIEITRPCPIDLMMCAKLMLEILIAGGTIAPPPPGPGPIEVLVGTTPNPGNPKGKDFKARLQNSLKQLDQILQSIDSGKWNGRFSKVVQDLDQLAKFLQRDAVTAPVVDRIKCAADILRHNTDIGSIRISIADRNNGKVPVGFDGSVQVSLADTKGNVMNPTTQLSDCTIPFLSTVTATGGGTATNPTGFGMAFHYSCNGPKPAKISTTLEFRPQSFIVIPPPGNGGGGGPITVTTSFSGVGEIVQPIRSFPLNDEFEIEQIREPRIKITDFMDYIVPFSIGNRIEYSILPVGTRLASVRIEIYDKNATLVRTLSNLPPVTVRNGGKEEVFWNGFDDAEKALTEASAPYTIRIIGVISTLKQLTDEVRDILVEERTVSMVISDLARPRKGRVTITGTVDARTLIPDRLRIGAVVDRMVPDIQAVGNGYQVVHGEGIQGEQDRCVITTSDFFGLPTPPPGTGSVPTTFYVTPTRGGTIRYTFTVQQLGRRVRDFAGNPWDMNEDTKELEDEGIFSFGIQPRTSPEVTRNYKASIRVSGRPFEASPPDPGPFPNYSDSKE